MWDKIIMSKEDCVFDGTIRNKGILFNDDSSLLFDCALGVTPSGKEATISFRYQIQPTVGFQRDYAFDQVQKVIIENKD